MLSYVRINRFTKSFKIVANEACRNMQIAFVGIDYIYYILEIADLILRNFVIFNDVCHLIFNKKWEILFFLLSLCSFLLNKVFSIILFIKEKKHYIELWFIG